MPVSMLRRNHYDIDSRGLQNHLKGRKAFAKDLGLPVHAQYEQYSIAYICDLAKESVYSGIGIACIPSAIANIFERGPSWRCERPGML